AAAAGVGLAWRVPRPAVRNAVAAVAVAGAAGLFGSSLAPAYALVALALAALYDVYAVYVSGHMAAVADASADLRLPSMFVVPTDDAYDDADLTVGGGGAPAATVLGAGDALFPAILVASAGVDASASGVAAPLGVPIGAWCTLAGALVGLFALQWVVHRRAGIHAGLPFVNGGAIAGYLLWVASASV
ncbi:presenilin family intramembrane aspartyl protease, partial [Candidatus Halobonum tyrrellensis]